MQQTQHEMSYLETFNPITGKSYEYFHLTLGWGMDLGIRYVEGNEIYNFKYVQELF